MDNHSSNQMKTWYLLVGIGLTTILSASLAPIDNEAGDGLLRFLGRFHILILHFPVVLLLIAPLADTLSRTQKYQSLKNHIVMIWWLATLSAVATVSLGLLLASTEGYSLAEVKKHLLGGISVTLLALLCTGLRSSLESKENKFLLLTLNLSNVLLISAVFYAAHAGGNLVHGDTYLTRFAPDPIRNLIHNDEKAINLAQVDDEHFIQDVQPLLKQYCFDCHGPDKQKGNVRIDTLDPDMVNGHDAPHWHAILDMINGAQMPPKKKPQLADNERGIVVDWMTQGLQLAKQAKAGDSQLVIRRLTKAQYTNSLKDLLGIDIDFGKVLPDDPISKLGFSNNSELLASSALHLEYFQNIAREALSKAIVTGEKPKKYHYRVHIGKGIGKGEPYLKSRGYMDLGLEPDNFYIEILDDKGKAMSGHQIETMKKNFSVSFRGSKKSRIHIAKQGLSLYSAVPHIERTRSGVYGAWNGPSPNVSLQVASAFPREGNFVMRVKASRADRFPNNIDNIASFTGKKARALLDKSTNLIIGKKTKQTIVKVKSVKNNDGLNHLEPLLNNKNILAIKKDVNDIHLKYNLTLAGSGHHYYQIDMIHPAVIRGDTEKVIYIGIDGSLERIVIAPTPRAKPGDIVVSSVAAAYLDSNKVHELTIKGHANFPGVGDIIFTKVKPNGILVNALEPVDLEDEDIASKIPSILPYIGTRTDDGMTYKNFTPSIEVNAKKGQPEIYTFMGRLENMPLPPANIESSSVNGGNLKLGLWNNHLVKNNKLSGPPLFIEYIEFEAPYFEQWPPQTHKNIFFDSENKKNKSMYAKEIISRFAEKAFRRPVNTDELALYVDYYHSIKNDFSLFEAGIKETLVAVLCSSNFLFLPKPENKLAQTAPSIREKIGNFLGIGKADASSDRVSTIFDYSLASKLSYFLWNSPPDQELLSLARRGTLKDNLLQQSERMIKHQKFDRFVSVFASEWLKLDRQQQQTIDVATYPDYTRFVKQDMAKETEEFLKYTLREDLSLLKLIDSEFVLLNQNLAEFYGIKNVRGNHFRPVKITKNSQRGGLLTQGSFLTGHSDGVHSHPIKRAVWLKEKILGKPAPPPPPNVPELDPATPGFEQLTLKQQLELHRDKASCRDCHAKIDPFGIVFENYDATGRFRKMYKGDAIDAASILPSGETVKGLSGIKHYILENNRDDFIRSIIKHLYSYALAKDANFHDEDEIDAILNTVKNNNYTAKSLINSIITSEAFIQ